MPAIDFICTIINKENISRNALIFSILINGLLSIAEVYFFSDIISSNQKYTGSYYAVINILPTIITVLVRFLFEKAYERKELIMRTNAKNAQALDDKARDMQNRIILNDSHKPINDYYKEFGNNT